MFRSELEHSRKIRIAPSEIKLPLMICQYLALEHVRPSGVSYRGLSGLSQARGKNNMQDEPVRVSKCPVCGDTRLLLVNRKPVDGTDPSQDGLGDVLRYRCFNGHFYSASQAAAT